MNPGVHAAITAAQAEEKRKRDMEEERMTRYTPDELDQEWEFKIVRSSTDAFRKPEIFQRVVEEETLAGWQLLEKLDNGRLRFKRPARARRRDAMLPEGIDPYRTQVGGANSQAAMVILGVLMAAMLGFGVLFMVSTPAGLNFSKLWPMIAAGAGIFVLAIAAVMMAARRK